MIQKVTQEQSPTSHILLLTYFCGKGIGEIDIIDIAASQPQIFRNVDRPGRTWLLLQPAKVGPNLASIHLDLRTMGEGDVLRPGQIIRAEHHDSVLLAIGAFLEVRVVCKSDGCRHGVPVVGHSLQHRVVSLFKTGRIRAKSHLGTRGFSL